VTVIDEIHRRLEEERRLRRAAVTALTQQAPEQVEPDDAETEDDSRAGQRHEQRALWLDAQIRKAMARGEFDNLPGTGKPIPGLDKPYDPDWWVKRLIEREKITGVLPPALALRKEDAELDERIDREPTEQDVRRLLEDFNQRVVEARRQLLGGPPVITPTRDIEQEVAGWRARREERRALQRQRTRSAAAQTRRARPARPRRASWWSRRRRNP
jgi:hypothetical protein